MYTIYSDVKNTTVWDSEQDRELITFCDGVAKTTDKRTVEILKNLGFGVHEEKPKNDDRKSK